MKLFIIIPAYNEENSIESVIKEIPKNIEGINEVKVLVIDDGSMDKTVQMSKEARADYIFCNKTNKGLAFSFGRGLEESLKLGADIIVRPFRSQLGHSLLEYPHEKQRKIKKSRKIRDIYSA